MSPCVQEITVSQYYSGIALADTLPPQQPLSMYPDYYAYNATKEGESFSGSR